MDAHEREERDRRAPHWQGIVYAGHSWEEGIFGAILSEQDAGQLDRSGQLSGWEFQLGLKSQAASAPRNWMILPETAAREHEIERIIALPVRTPFFRVAKAQHVAGYVRELLDCARCIIPPDQDAWVSLEREDLRAWGRINWNVNVLASVWVSERLEVFRGWPASMELQEGMAQTAAEVRKACDEMAEEAHDQIRECRIEWSESDTQYAAFMGPGDVLATLGLRTRHVGDILAVPADVAEKKAYMGPALIPLRVDERFPMAVRLGVGPSWKVQCEAMRAIETFVREGVSRQKTEQWCMLCASSFLYLGPIRMPTSSISVLAFEVELGDRPV